MIVHTDDDLAFYQSNNPELLIFSTLIQSDLTEILTLI